MSVRSWGLHVTLAAVMGCGGRTPTKADEPMDAGVEIEPDAGPTERRESDKLDVLLVVDNTRTASFAHPALARTIPYLLDRLMDPPCVNGLGQVVDTPAPGAACERGQRDFVPLRDVHIGIISSSIGGHGADTCSPASGGSRPAEDDRAQLLSRNAAGGTVPTYGGLGFLTWDPDQAASPPGDADRLAFENKLVEIVEGVGDEGCGFEAPLEALYRFLIDPEPYASISLQGGVAVPTGVDQVLLQQRAAFLRPDSAVLVVLVSDEDDCSIIDGGQSYLVAQSQAGAGAFHMPRPRSVCATDPDDPCCTSCGAAPPPGCDDDPACSQGPLDESADPLNLRCFDQKRRFGIDFLYPVERYVDGLSERSVTNALGEVKPNPLLVGDRSPEMIHVVAIAGVPWQDIAISEMSPAGGYRPAHEIAWGRLLSDGTSPPGDPLMVPARLPRMGTHPVTGDEVAPPEATAPDANPINGHEHLLANELQYACIYELDQPVPCVGADCACNNSSMAAFNPVCQQDDGTYGSVQRFGRATPATRQLALVRALPSRGALASICTLPVFDEQSPGFAYKPAVDAMMRTLRRSLPDPETP